MQDRNQGCKKSDGGSKAGNQKEQVNNRKQQESSFERKRIFPDTGDENIETLIHVKQIDNCTGSDPKEDGRNLAVWNPGEEPDPFLCWFSAIIELSDRKKIMLTEEHEPEDLYEMPEMALRQLCEYLQVNPQPLLNARRMPPDRDAKRLREQGISLVTRRQQAYPRKLRLIDDPPFALYYKGKLPPDSVSAAIVGARKCSEYGRMTARALGEKLAKNGIPVISGMAYGIDSEGHIGALRGNGRTWAVLGCGADICYPSRGRRLYEQIPESGGGILSEFPPGTPPLPNHFPVRNRLISGLSDLTIVVEARLRSGSLITADFAMEQGKEVYAVPGRICDPFSSGTNHLIEQGAGILTNIDQFLKDHNLWREDPAVSEELQKIRLDPEEKLLYRCLDTDPKYLDVLVDESGLPVRETLEILDRLRRRGLVKENYKNYFCRICT